ncbi:MAG: TIGR03016 family PEP-CTERM system-associated outer membrane protein [Pseudomonadota bacterium]
MRRSISPFPFPLMRRSVAPTCLLVALGCMLANPVLAQWGGGSVLGSGNRSSAGAGATRDSGADSQRAWKITPSFSSQLMYSDNIALSATDAESEWVLGVSPGIAIDGRTRRLKSRLQYQLNQLVYFENDQHNQSQNQLNTFNTLMLVDDRVYLDVSGRIGQQSLSALGAGSGRDYNLDGNRVETSSYDVSPYVRGLILGRVKYDLRYRHTLTRSDGEGGTDYAGDEFNAQFGSTIGKTRLSWSLAYQATQHDYDGQPSQEGETLTGLLNIKATPRLNLALGVLTDRNDYEGDGSSHSTGLALGVEWRPSPRTTLTARWDERGYGNTYDVTFNHRRPLSELRYTLSRGATALPANLAYTGYGGLYDLLYDQLQSSTPDPDARADAVRKILADYGLEAGSLAPGDFLRNQVTLQERHQMQWIKRGARNILTLSVEKSDSRSMTEFGLPLDPLDTGNQVQQTSLSATWSHKLSKRSNLSGTVVVRKNNGENEESREKSISVGYSKSLGEHANLSMTLTRRDTEGTESDDYTENSLMLLFGYRF